MDDLVGQLTEQRKDFEEFQRKPISRKDFARIKERLDTKDMELVGEFSMEESTIK